MGAALQKLAPSGNNSDEFERILTDLDGKIKRTEVQLLSTRTLERKRSVLLVLYSFVLYVGIAVYLFLAPQVLGGSLRRRSALAQLEHYWPLIVFPIIIYFLRRILQLFYQRKISGLESSLQALRAKKKLKLEELKNKTAYYKTKGLLERFSDDGVTPMKPRSSKNLVQEMTSAKPVVSQPLGMPRSHSISVMGSAPTSFQLQQQENAMPVPSQPRSFSVAAASSPHNVPPFVSPATTVGTPGPSEATVPPVLPLPVAVPPRSWFDRFMDVMVGDNANDPASSRLALICAQCHQHNGLVRLEDLTPHFQYRCPGCQHLNSVAAPRPTSSVISSPNLSQRLDPFSPISQTQSPPTLSSPTTEEQVAVAPEISLSSESVSETTITEDASASPSTRSRRTKASKRKNKKLDNEDES